MKYKVVIASSQPSAKVAAEKLTKMVNIEIKNGWEPIGGVSIGDEYKDCAQAMIKR